MKIFTLNKANKPKIRSEAVNKLTYSREDIVSLYATADYLTEPEKLLFERHLGPDLKILDLGVGGGRTSTALAPQANEYIGVDYSVEMIESCRRRYPQWRYEVMDAADLSAFPDCYFDVVVFSFNGLGNLYPDQKRLGCLKECLRVLKPEGILIFSLHNAKSLILRPPKLNGLASVRAVLGNIKLNVTRFSERITSEAYWISEGYIENNTHGGMLVYMAVPEVVKEQLESIGFEWLDTLGDDYPARNVPWLTRWYYYAARKPK